jgi:hypothetical protein
MTRPRERKVTVVFRSRSAPANSEVQVRWRGKAIGVALVAMLISVASAIASSQPSASAEPSPTPASSSPSTPQQVLVGVYLKNIEAIDLENNSYYLSFIMWMRWRGEIDPTQTFRFTNVMEEWAMTSTAAYQSPLPLEDGWRYQRFTVDGRFFHKFWLGTFPLDWQKVTLELEDTRHTTDQLVYVPDTEASHVNPELTIPGWQIIEVYNEESTVEYETNFGLGPREQALVPHYRFGVKIERPVSFYLLKVVPPIMITLLCCLSIFFVNPRYVDARLATPVAVLLTEVFLQLSFTTSLPDVAIPLLIDHLFTFSYFLVLLCLLVCIATTRMVARIEDDQEALALTDTAGERERLQARIDAIETRMARLNRRAALGLTVLLIVGVAVITLAIRGTYLFEMLSR